MVRLTHCEHSSKFPSDAFLQDSSRCQFGERFWKHKLVCTTLVWIAGQVAPLNKCRIARSSRLQVSMLSKPTCNYVVACEFDPSAFQRQWFGSSKAKQRATAEGPMALDCMTFTVLHSALGVRNDRQANPYVCPFAGHAVPSSTCQIAGRTKELLSLPDVSLGNCSASTSWSVLRWFGSQAMLLQ